MHTYISLYHTHTHTRTYIHIHACIHVYHCISLQRMNMTKKTDALCIMYHLKHFMVPNETKRNYKLLGNEKELSWNMNLTLFMGKHMVFHLFFVSPKKDTILVLRNALRLYIQLTRWWHRKLCTTISSHILFVGLLKGMLSCLTPWPYNEVRQYSLVRLHIYNLTQTSWP